MREDLFLRAILAGPNDETLRLVYADWLEEQGDPRSDYLRMEVEAHSTSLSKEERNALEERLRQASEVLDARWLRIVSRPVEAKADVNDINSPAFAFLAALDELYQGGKRSVSVLGLGWDLRLTNEEIKSVIGHLWSQRMIEWRSSSRQRGASDRLTRNAVVSARGRAHVRAMLGSDGSRE